MRVWEKRPKRGPNGEGLNFTIRPGSKVFERVQNINDECRQEVAKQSMKHWRAKTAKQ